MAGSFFNTAENLILDHVFGKQSWTMPTIYVGLSTTTPAEDATNITEPSGNNYGRVTTSGTTWNSASAGSISNANDITFNEATGSWGTITYVVLYTASSGGTAVAYASLGTSKAIASGDTLKFTGGTPGNLVFTLD